jgi:hypothetical protein
LELAAQSVSDCLVARQILSKPDLRCERLHE